MRGKERLVTAAMVGILALSGCRSEDLEKATPFPTISAPRTEQTASAESAWNNLSALERINRLELKDLPKGINIDRETVKAVSELYCKQMPCKIPPENAQANTHFVDTDTFLMEYQKGLGRPFLSDAEREEAIKYPEIVIKNPDQTKKIFLNKPRISTFTSEVRASMSPQEIKQLGKHDLEIIVKNSIIAHALSHLNEPDEKLNFDPVPIAIDNKHFLITGINSLALKMINLDNGSSLVLTGTNEAMAEQAAYLLDKPSGFYVLSRAYLPATMLVGKLNQKAGINDNEFKDYYFGKKSIKDLLIKWGSIKDPNKPDVNSGITLYFLTALAADPRNNPETIRQFIEQEIGQKLPN